MKRVNRWVLEPNNVSWRDQTMASTNRSATDFLAMLEDDPRQFGFFQFMRLIDECTHPEKPRLGTSQRPVDDPIRLAQEPSLAFESATLTNYKPGTADQPPRLSAQFMGLLGPNGPLPLHLTEYSRDRERNHNDPTFARFLDIFHHRMLSLFYRAWANGEPTVNFDRADSDRFGLYIGSLAGLGMDSLRNTDFFSDLDNKFHYSGHLSGQTHHPEGLLAMLRDYLCVNVTMQEFIGEWLDLPENALCRLGHSSSNARLGVSVTVGARVWSCHSKFRLIVGPLPYQECQALLPGGDWLSRLVALVRNYVGDELAWDINLLLEAGETPALRLDGANRLGWTSWLGHRPTEKDADDLVLNAFKIVHGPGSLYRNRQA